MDILNVINMNIWTQTANQYKKGYLMPIYAESSSEIFVWGIPTINGYSSRPLKSNKITLSPTKNPSIAPTTKNPSNAPSESKEVIVTIPYNQNNEEVYSQNDNDMILLFGILGVIVFCCGGIAMLYIKFDDKNYIKNKNKSKHEFDSEPLAQTDSELSLREKSKDRKMSNERIVRMSSKSNNVKMVGMDVRSVGSLDVDEIKFDEDDEDEFGAMTVRTQATSLLGHLNDSDSERNILPIISDHEMVEGVHSDQYDEGPQQNDAESVSEVQFEGLRKNNHQYKHNANNKMF